MATRLFVQNAAAAYDPPTERGAWDSTLLHVPIKLDRLKSGAITSVGIVEAVTTNPMDQLILKAVSEPLAAQTITGTVQLCLGALESNGGMNCEWHLHVYAIIGDTDVVRGTFLTNYAPANPTNEWPTVAAGHSLTAGQNLTSVALSENDRIVCEIGYAAYNGSATPVTGTLWYGGTGSDLTAGGDETTLVGWVEFSQNLTFSGGGGQSQAPRSMHQYRMQRAG